jgi:N-acetyl sugar amidotransferase
MRFCSRCLYPENAKPTISFDEEGVCSGCRYHESRRQIDWEERWEMLEELLDGVKECIVPVSGGKDSHYQVWLLKEKFGIKPLLVTYNHGFNSGAGNRNLENLVKRSGCDLVRYNTGPDSARRLSRLMLERVGDLTWHYHAGIMTWPFQVAKQYGIDLIVWGEHGFAELTGMVSLNDFVEFTNWKRKEHDMRGVDPTDIVGEGGVVGANESRTTRDLRNRPPRDSAQFDWTITSQDIRPLIWPEGEVATGIYLSNFLPWNAKNQAEQMIRDWDFAPVTYPRERTFNQYAKIEDHANDLHDYLKFLKFGYGRATDDASTEIRHGRLTRGGGVHMVRKYDPVEPSTLEEYCDFLGITSADFYAAVPERQQTEEPPIDGEELPQSEERTFAFTSLYYDPENPPPKSGDERLDRLGQFQPI